VRAPFFWLLSRYGRFYMPSAERQREIRAGTENALLVNTPVTTLWPGTSSVRCEMLLDAESRFGVPFRFRIYVAGCTSEFHFMRGTIHHNAPIPPSVTGVFIGRARVYTEDTIPHHPSSRMTRQGCCSRLRFQVDAMYQYHSTSARTRPNGSQSANESRDSLLILAWGRHDLDIE